jgi:hypothetical protein
MFKKQIKIYLALIIGVMITLACGLTNPQSTTPSDSTSEQPTEEVVIEGLCDNPLYPVKQNATWTYANTGSPSGDFTYTDTITQVRSDGFTLTSQFGDLTRTQEWACETGGLKALQLGGGPTASLSTQDMSAQFTTTQVTGTTLPKELIPGMQWLYGLTLEGTTDIPGDQQAQSTGTFTITMQEMGKETVTVPAGTFEATKLQANSTMDIMAEFQGLQVPMTITGSSLLWYAPNVGFIKSVDNVDMGDGTPFTTTTELQSYNIP